jgi:hypothetical protein
MSNEGFYQLFEEPQKIATEKHKDQKRKAQSPSSKIETETEVVVIPIDRGIRVIIPESTE